VIYWFLGISAILVAALVALSFMSREPGDLGLENGGLRLCPDSPNCVVTEGPSPGTEPLLFDGDAAGAWEAAKRSVEDIGGAIRQDEGGYLWATFSSKIFRFIDDLELRMDRQRGSIHVRSASRVGHSDLGVNAKRVEALRKAFRERMGER
jgi:uncharacterized protein (DUF1499 family)